MISSKFKCFFILCGLLVLLGHKSDKYIEPFRYTNIDYFPKMLPTSNSPSIEGAELGRFLFYDPILSGDSSFSCASCHKQEKAFSDSPRRFSKGIKGTFLFRNTQPIFNLPWYSSLFWDGRAITIEEQVFFPVRSHDEMNLDWKEAESRINNSSFYRMKFQNVFGVLEIDSILIGRAIAQFERTLISNNSKFDRVIRGEDYLTKDEYEGFEIMNDQTKGDCLHCHTTDADVLGTTLDFSNNGLDAFKNYQDFKDLGRGEISGMKNDIGKFRVPTLRNVAVTEPYMHDGRFASLKEVLDFYSEGVKISYNIDSKMEYAHLGGVHLTDEEKRKVISFLRTLTDSTFITNPDFSNPFN